MTYWYKEAIIYEVHVKCFYDSSATGIGDFKGLTEKLDYLQDLGVTAIWLLPFYPSPLRDDGYDIADYNDVHPHYGSLKDFREFLRAAHDRGLKVITELVINHTSDQHPWFQRARKKDAKDWERQFYVWNSTPEKYRQARIIFQDFEPSNWAWDREAGLYYWHRFYSHQPDLNFENPAVHAAVFKVLSFWFKLGVDGVRLDAVPYLYEKEGTSCENLPATHAFLKSLRAYVDAHFPDKMLLAEANQWPEEAAKYFGEGDECHMAFHFPVMPRLFMSIHLEDSLPIIEIMGQTPAIPDNSQWALFLRNHDELTLEMVTDEERDYMYRVYAFDPQARINLGIRRRLAPLLKNDRRKIELMNVLLFSLHGTPVLYYGDEIGMGDNIYLGDRNGVRTPMQWSSDKNAGFSRANPQQLYLPPIIDPEYHYETVNVEAQLNNPHSLLWWTKQLLSLRKRFNAFSYGKTSFLNVKNRKMLVFFRECEEELILIVANLSRYPQYVELNLKQYNGYSLVEIFSGERFPSIGELPYFLTAGPYGYYWFSLEKQQPQEELQELERKQERQVEELSYPGDQRKLFFPSERRILDGLVRKYLLKRHWFRALLPKLEKTKIRVIDHAAFNRGGEVHLLLIEIHLLTGEINYLPLFLEIVEEKELHRIIDERPHRVVARINGKNDLWGIVDCLGVDSLQQQLFQLVVEQRKISSEQGLLRGVLLGSLSDKAELKVFSQLEEGKNMDVEMREFLTRQTNFKNFFPLIGYLEYEGADKRARTLVEIVEGATKPEFSAKENFIETALRFLQRMEAASPSLDETLLLPKKAIWTLALDGPDPSVKELLGEHNEMIDLIGTTAAQFHTAVWQASTSADFSSVFYTLFYQRSLYQVMLRKVNETFDARPQLLPLKEKVLRCIAPFAHTPVHSARLRHHGHFTLENLYFNGREILLANFGMQSPSSYHVRKYKRSPVRDLVFLIVSIVETGFEALEKLYARGVIDANTTMPFQSFALAWGLWTAAAFLKAYQQSIPHAPFLPPSIEELNLQLSIFLIERCIERIGEGRVLQTENEAPQLFLRYLLSLYES